MITKSNPTAAPIIVPSIDNPAMTHVVCTTVLLVSLVLVPEIVTVILLTLPGRKIGKTRSAGLRGK
jgi:hypothetical protein